MQLHPAAGSSGWTAAGHSTDAQEDQGRIQTGLDADIQNIQQSAVRHDVPIAVVVFSAFFQKRIPQFGVVQGVGRACTVYEEVGYIDQQATECDTYQQQRFELLFDTQIQQQAGYRDHHKVFPAAVSKEADETGIVQKILKGFKHVHEYPSFTPARSAENRFLP